MVVETVKNHDIIFLSSQNPLLVIMSFVSSLLNTPVFIFPHLSNPSLTYTHSMMESPTASTCTTTTTTTIISGPG